MKRSAAEILREYGPFPGVDHVHGVTYDGKHVWFAAGDPLKALDPADGDVRRIDPATGEVAERLEMPPGAGVSGLESDGGDRFFCGGGSSGRLRAVRRPRRPAAAGSGAESR